MPAAVIVEAVRTPIGKRGGAFADLHPVDLAAHVMRALAERTGINPADITDEQTFSYAAGGIWLATPQEGGRIRRCG